MGFLSRVLNLKKDQIDRLDVRLERSTPVLDPLNFLKKNPVIAEIKRRSPSRGLIKEVNPVFQAFLYKRSGAGAVSVVTEEYFFGGSPSMVKAVKKSVMIPVLFKDFIISEKQIELAFSVEADVVLLIARILGKSRLKELASFAKDIGLYVLVELHDEDEIDLLDGCEFDMVGVNSRDLETLSVDLSKMCRVGVMLPDGVFKVAESGIKSKEDVLKVKSSGFDAILVGEALMLAEDVEEKISMFCNVMRG